MSKHSGRYDAANNAAKTQAELARFSTRRQRVERTTKYGLTAKEQRRSTDEEAQNRKDRKRREREIAKLLKLQQKLAKTKKAATPAEIRFAEQNFATSEPLTQTSFSSESGHIRLDVARNLMLILLAISLLLTSIGCSNNVGTVDIAPTAIATQVAPEASPAPPAVTPVTEEVPAEEPASEEETSPGNEETPPIEESPVAEESPEVTGTEIPVQAIIDAAAEQGITLTPEAIATFNVQTEDDKIRLRKTTNTVEVIVTPEGGPVRFISIPNGTIIEEGQDTADVSDDVIKVTNENGYEVLSIERDTSVMTETPEPEAAPTAEGEPGTEEPPVDEGTAEPPTPEVSPENNVELAQAVVGPETLIDHLGSLELPLVEDKNNANPTAVTYRVAYDANGIIVARFSNENGGDPQWIAGGPFSNNELNGGSSNFPCAVNGFNYCGVQLRVSQYLELGSYDSGNAIRLLDSSGNPSPFFMEDGVIAYYLDASGKQQVAIYPTLIVNETTGQRMNMDNFHETAAPNWQFTDFLIRRSELYFLTHFDETLFDNPRNESTNYYLNPNAVRPALGPLDILTMSFPYPGRTPSGNDEITGNYQFLSPLTTGLYSGDSYQSFMVSGDLSLLQTTNFYNGIPIFIPNNGIIWEKDTARPALE